MRGRGENGPDLAAQSLVWKFCALPDQQSCTHPLSLASSAPHFYAVPDQAVRLPGATSLLSFISNAAVFLDPSLQRDCSARTCSDSLQEGLPKQRPVPPHPGMFALPLLLPTPRDHGWVPACPRKVHVIGRVAGAFQGSWKIPTCIWPQSSPLMTLFHHQQIWLFSGVCWDRVATQPPPDVHPIGELPLLVWPQDNWPSLSPGDLPFPPEHRQAGKPGELKV
ncbi:uncharacterized protein LOC122234544 [Panthera tigris]|uniref:uncharacterized protein LOC122234544 n=1 Tax=Panthera tigris TaxID=9694 RepID=UPI001C6F9B4F|nr:uncharacterized protein LOC122234544 [Panthera tigris]